MSQKICSHCGKQVDTMNGTIEFCPFCGKNMQFNPPKRSSRVWLFTGIVLLVIMLGVLIALLCFGSPSSNKTEPKPDTSTPKSDTSAKKTAESPKAKYQKATEHLNNGEFAEAYALFEELGDYKDAKEQLEKFEWVVSKETDEFYGIHEYEYDKNGLVKKKTTLLSNDDTHTYEYEYNKNGLKTKEQFINSGQIYYTIEYAYNANNLVLQEIYDDFEGEHYTTQYEYDTNGHKTKEIIIFDSIYYNDVHENKFEHNSYTLTDGYMTTEIETDSDGDIHTRKCTYSSDDLLTELFVETHCTNGEISEEKYEYEYNEEGLLIKKIHTDQSGYQYIYEYEYEYTPVIRKFKDK